jgi:MFS transporter, AAHS family, vanillate permease
MTALSSEDPRAIILSSPMSPYQSRAVAITVTLCALDGFNVLSVTLAAPGIVHDWGVGKGALGLVFSVSLVGMAAGSLLISPLADVLGRRKVILLSLALMAFGLLASITAHSIAALALWRVITGLGIGAMISVIYPLAAEYANARRRDLAVGLTAVGYPIGGVVGGLIVAALLLHFDWRSVFIFGAVVAVLITPIVYLGLPESVPYLVARGDHRALEQVNSFLRRSKLPQGTALPAPNPISRTARLNEIFRPGLLGLTLQVTFINLLYVISVYYMLSWIPQMVSDLGFSASQAARISVTANLGGVLGGAALGWAAYRLGLKRLVLLAFTGAAVMTTLFGFTSATLPLLTLVAAIAGVFLFAGMSGVYAVVARTFEAHTRATGTGFVVGVGRASSALAPAISGYLLASGLSRAQVSVVMAVPALLAAAILLVMPVREIKTDGSVAQRKGDPNV